MKRYLGLTAYVGQGQTGRALFEPRGDHPLTYEGVPLLMDEVFKAGGEPGLSYIIAVPYTRRVVRRRGKTMVYRRPPAWLKTMRRYAAREAVDLTASEAARLKATGMLA